MSSLKSFGRFDSTVTYQDRRAAYVVIISHDSTVAVIKERGKYWLPGGGSLPEETAEETVVRELREELARDIRIMQKIGQATQYFYAELEDCHYKMEAAFFRAEFAGEQTGTAEYDLHWALLTEPSTSFYHECQAWAIQQAAQLLQTR